MVKMQKKISEYLHLDKGNVCQIRITQDNKQVQVINLSKNCLLDITIVSGTINEIDKTLKI